MSRGLGSVQRAVWQVLTRHHETHEQSCGCLSIEGLATLTSRKKLYVYFALRRLNRRGLVEHPERYKWMKAELVASNEGCRNRRRVKYYGAKNRLAALQPRPSSGSVYRVRQI